MAEKNDRKNFLLTASSGRLMVSLSLPAIVGMVVIGLYTFVDAIYAGQLISTSAMGAVSIAYPFTFINSGIACLIGMGSASVLSRAIGAGDQNAVDESTNKTLKEEFVYQETFSSLHDLQVRLSDYVHWYNHRRLHSTLGYMSPVEFREAGLSL